jgi:hypothetical protein
MSDISIYDTPLQINITVTVYTPPVDHPVIICKFLYSTSLHAHLTGALQSTNDYTYIALNCDKIFMLVETNAVNNCYWHLYVLGRLHYRMTLRTAKSDRDVRTRLIAFCVHLGTRYVTICLVSLVAGSRGEKRYTMRRMERGLWAGGG